MNDLPNSWAVTTIRDITVDCAQKVPSMDEAFQYIDISSVDRTTKTIISPQVVIGANAPSRARKLVVVGDVLVSMTRPNLNAVALISENMNNQIASTGFEVLRSNGIDPRWLFYLVRTQEFVNRMSELVQGALYPAVRSKDIRGYEVPIAPLNEQKRIANKLDALLARVDACRERLDRIPAILKRFRQAVLAAATSGKLTEDWRETEKYLDALSDLKQIINDRKHQSKKIKPPKEHLNTEEFSIPNDWNWTSLDTLACQIVDGTHHTPTYVDEGIPFISVKDIQNGQIYFTDTKFISATEHKELAKRCNPQKGDLLITKSGTIGRTAIIATGNYSPLKNI